MQLSLAFLGTFQVTCDGVLLPDFPSQAARALLAYLSLEAGRLHEREHLATLLWPDAALAQGLTNLRQALHRLRTVLGLSEDNPVLLVTRQSIRLESAAVALDVHAFEQHLAATRVHRHRHLWACQSCIEHVQAAVALYPGELLSGFSFIESMPFEEWLLVRREGLHQQFIVALDTLVTHHIARNNLTTAAALLRRWLTLEPWDEAVHTRLIDVLWRAGQRSAALRQFERCRVALNTELGAEPGPEMLALVERVRRGDLPLVRSPFPVAMPTSTTPFVRRKRELAQIAERLATPECRLLTLVGLGGSGKTRLALEIAAEEGYAFADGAVFVPLVGVESNDGVVRTIATALGVELTTLGVELTTVQSALPQICSYLRDKELLLVLDNLEHLTSVDGLICDILAATRHLQLLVTSRVPLDLRAEWLLPVAGMAVPLTNYEPVDMYEAGRLFMQAARQMRPDFVPTAADTAAIATICRLVDGVPLAIDLAAAHVRELSVPAIATAITANREVLATTMRDMPVRHRSIQAVFTWSWNLLNAAERTLLARLSVFRGTFTAEAARVVTGATVVLLQRLCRHSLLRCDEHGNYLLHELVRQFAVERLAAEGTTAIQQTADKHSTYYISLAADYETSLHGPASQTALAALIGEIGNLRQAWNWALEQRHSPLIAQGMCTVRRFYARASLAEGLTIFADAVERLRGTMVESSVLGHLLTTLAWFHTRHLQHDAARACADEALLLARINGDLELEAEALLARGEALVYGGNYLAAMNCFGRAGMLVQHVDTRTGMLIAAHCLLHQGDVHYWLGYFHEAIGCAERALQLYQDQGDLRYQGLTLNRLGEYKRRQGDYAHSREHRLSALALIRESGDASIENRVLNDLGEVHLHLGCYAEARDYLMEAVELSRRIGDFHMESGAFEGLGRAYLYLGEPERAHACAIQAQALAPRGESVNSGFIPTCLGYALEALGDMAGAAAAYREGVRCFATQTTIRAGVEPLAGLARMALARNDVRTARDIGKQLHASLSLDPLCDALDPLRVHLTCYESLAAVGDELAEQVLGRAITLLDEQAARISDLELRWSFLERVPHHQALQALVEQRQISVAA